MKNYLLSGVLFLIIAGVSSCDKLPNSAANNAPTSPVASTAPASNADTSNWKGMSSDGTSSLVNQVSTGDNTYSFTETWTLADGSKVETEGTGVYDDASKTNVYTYTKPKAAVVKVSTEEKDDGNTTIDTVLESTSDLFSVGEKITYSKQP